MRSPLMATTLAFNLTDVKIYLVKADGTIEAADKAWIDGAYVVVYATRPLTTMLPKFTSFDTFAEKP